MEHLHSVAALREDLASEIANSNYSQLNPKEQVHTVKSGTRKRARHRTILSTGYVTRRMGTRA